MSIWMTLADTRIVLLEILGWARRAPWVSSRVERDQLEWTWGHFDDLWVGLWVTFEGTLGNLWGAFFDLGGHSGWPWRALVWPWGYSGWPLGDSGWPLGVLGVTLGGPYMTLGVLWATFGTLWVTFGDTLGELGWTLGDLWVTLGGSGWYFGALWVTLGCPFVTLEGTLCDLLGHFGWPLGALWLTLGGGAFCDLEGYSGWPFGRFKWRLGGLFWPWGALCVTFGHTLDDLWEDFGWPWGPKMGCCRLVLLAERWSRLVEAAHMSGWPDCTDWLRGWCRCWLQLVGSTGGTMKSAGWGCTGVRLAGLHWLAAGVV